MILTSKVVLCFEYNDGKPKKKEIGKCYPKFELLLFLGILIQTNYV